MVVRGIMARPPPGRKAQSAASRASPESRRVMVSPWTMDGREFLSWRRGRLPFHDHGPISSQSDEP
jgi:hypothetical protein